MLNKKKIIAIFNQNYFIKELITLLEDEGLEINKIKNIEQSEELISNKILLLDIDSKKRMKNVKKFLEQKARDCNIFVTHEENLKIDLEDVTILKPPIILKDFINQIYRICKKNENSKNLVKVKNFQFNFKNNELIFDGTKKKIRLTELESRLLKFLSANIKGSTKQELLSKVWGHNTILDTHTLESLIYRLRKKIEKNPNQPKLLILKEKKYFLIKS
tara:strand:+ start:62 stop:715 length:654 start_codon:yes stop_codon:yes gene_type:complete